MRRSATIVLFFVFCLSFGQGIDSLLKQLENASIKEKPQLLIALSDASMNSDNGSALHYAEQARIAASDIGDTVVLTKALLMKGELLTAFDSFTKARAAIEGALEFAVARNDTVLMAHIYGAMGGLYSSLFDHPEALRYYRKGVDFAKTTGNIHLVAKIMNNMAGVFEIQGEYDLALKTFSECTQALETANLSGQRIYYITLLNSGMVSNAGGDNFRAIPYLKKALYGFRTLALPALEVHTLVGLVHTYTNLGQVDSALAYYRLTESFSEQFSFAARRHYKDQTYLELLLRMKRYEEIIPLAQTKLNEIGQDTSFFHFSASATRILYQTYKAMGKSQLALQYLESFNEYDGYTQSQEAEEEVRLLRTRFEAELDFETQHREIVELQLREDLQEKEIERQKYWRNFILVIFLMGLTISGLILNGLKLKKKASEAESQRLELDNTNLHMEVEHKNRELTSTALFVAQKNQLLIDLQKQLANISSSSEPISQKEFRSLRNQIKENIRLEEDWGKIKLHFEEVYPQFFDNIKSKHSSLTSLELKHCAYLRMNLSVKEVARMLSVAPKSVQMSHYRLKKKIGLTSEQSLGSYLASF